MGTDIQQYIHYFRNQLPEIAQLQNKFYRKVLYVTVIDTLSRAGGFSEHTRDHRERVITFLDECSSWGDKDKVSSSQLKLALEHKEKTSGTLYEAVKSRVERWPCSTIIGPDRDPTIDQLRPLATQEEEQKILKDKRYVQLLYTYRNHLVHEFRQPGEGSEFVDDRCTPYYHEHDTEGSWELVFPTPFFHKLCCSCIDGLETHLFKNGRNPFNAYHFGTPWTQGSRKKARN